MEIDGQSYVHGVVRIEIEKVRGEYAQFVRVKIRGASNTMATLGDTVSLTCFSVDTINATPEVIIIDKDERDKPDAIDAKHESD